MSEAELRPSEGWGVIHLFLRARRGEPAASALDAIARFAAVEPNQVIASSVLGGRADVALMCLSPDLDALDRLVKDLLAGPLERLDSFVSLTEHSEYTTTEPEERARLEAAGEPGVEAALATWRERMDHYKEIGRASCRERV